MASRVHSAVLGAFLSVFLGVGTSEASEGAGHLAYGLGGATGPYRGFRQNLDLAIFPVLLQTLASGTYVGKVSLAAGASAMLGFGVYPSDASFEVGPAFSTYLGGIATLGPVVRFGGEKFERGGGAQFRLAADILLIEVGLRVIQIVSVPRETQMTLTAGVGRF